MLLWPIVLQAPPHARAALRVETTQFAPGKAFLAAVEISTDPHWHVYWRNPGDSGVATKIGWRAPKGWKVEPLEWPVPKRFTPGGIASYGYEGKTLFLARVTPTTAGGVLAADAKWLVCQEACVIGGATVAMKLKPGALKASPHATRLRLAQRELPSPAAGWTLRALAGKRVILTATPSRGVSVPEGPVEFFPFESGVIDQGRPAIATREGTRFVFTMDPSPFPEKRSRLAGLMIFTIAGRRQALLVNPLIKPGS